MCITEWINVIQMDYWLDYMMTFTVGNVTATWMPFLLSILECPDNNRGVTKYKLIQFDVLCQ
jgi:hypothetical protein